jgi:hypothetical protein
MCNRSRNIFRFGGFSARGVNRDVREWNPIAESRTTSYKTSRSICDEVGERLQQDLRLEASSMPRYLKRLIDELRKRDE